MARKNANARSASGTPARPAKGAVRRGFARPDACIDLHRFTVDQAESALVQFLDRSFLDGRQFVLVIHGAKMLMGVVNRTLRNHPLVEACESEPGNPGATRAFLGER